MALYNLHSSKVTKSQLELFRNEGGLYVEHIKHLL